MNSAAIHKELEELGSSLSLEHRDMPYSVPGSYFAGNPAVTRSVTLLKGLSDEMPFETPEFYFVQNPSQMLQLAKAGEVQKGRTIPLSYVRIAAAAVLLICIGLGGYTTLMQTAFRQPDRILSSVTKTDIQTYLEATGAQDADEAVQVAVPFDRRDIVAYLNDTGWE